MIWPKSSDQQALRELYAFNLDEETLRSRFIDPYERAEPITWHGRTLDGGDVAYLRVSETETPLAEESIRRNFLEHEAFTAGEDVTNHWVLRAAGSLVEAKSAAPQVTDLTWIVQLCRRFDIVVRRLRRRHARRETLDVNDEYDVQDLLHALLLVRFDDVRAESWNPTYLGGASRIDFLIPEAEIIVEVKKTRGDLTERKIGDQLAEEVTRYSDPAANRGASTLICFIYDPDRGIANPKGLENDLAAASNERLQVVGVVGQ
jgi:REase_DpnII-MboI